MEGIQAKTGMKIPWCNSTKITRVLTTSFMVLFIVSSTIQVSYGQGLNKDYTPDDNDDAPASPPPAMNECNGVFLTYSFQGREKEYPHVKNVTAQSWSFKSTATIVNTGRDEVKGWQMYIGFQHDEIIVSADGGVPVNGGDFPLTITKGATFTGYPNTDLKTAIDTANDFNQISAKIDFIGTLFGAKLSVIPMPKTIKLNNDGYMCPATTRQGGNMHVCCRKNPKFKAKKVTKTKYMPRRNGDLNIVYDILQTFDSKYMAQVTIDNHSPLGRLDHWNLTWEWTRGEFIYSMKGAYTKKRDPSVCIYGKPGLYYKQMDFSTVMNCETKPTISDLPAEKKEDDVVGKLPYCCKNGTLLPSLMDPGKSKSIFQLQVFKLPPDLNRTAFYPPQHWKIDGVLNPQYKCGPPMRVEPSQFPDFSGLPATSYAIASWQVVCNITKPKKQASRCCVSFSAFYSESAIPCNTCACGCEDEDTDTCNPNANPMLLPPDALLVPFVNRTKKAVAWAKLNHMKVPRRKPCPDNCGVSINWHINSDFKKGWTSRITIFNWRNFAFEDWFVAVNMGKAFPAYENVYSFNGTKLSDKSKTIFFQGLPGLNYLAGQTNGSNPFMDPKIPGKQQTVISFNKEHLEGLNILNGDGFPKKVYFNGEECSLPNHFPTSSGVMSRASMPFISSILIGVLIALLTDYFH